MATAFRKSSAAHRMLRLISHRSGPRFSQSLCSHVSFSTEKTTTKLTPAIVKRVQRMVEDPKPTPIHRKLDHLEKKRQEALEEISILNELKSDAAGNDEAEQECVEEVSELQDSISTLETKIVDTLLEARDNEDNDGGTDAIIEVRAGTGGDEASLFTQELMDCYKNTAKKCKFGVELLTETYTHLGGIRESSISITGSAYGGGDDVKPYDFFRFESGVHRVQRVPVNDTKIHTSACSVAVLPQQASGRNKTIAEIPPAELRIDTMRASGAGGQHVNTTDSAVRITHIPTGTTVSIQDERSQHQNKEKAMKLITARVLDAQKMALAAEQFQTRRGLLGGGDRHERIRTYNYPQDRVTDHRCKETRYGIASLLGGDKEVGLVATYLPYLRDMIRQEQLQELEEDK